MGSSEKVTAVVKELEKRIPGPQGDSFSILIVPTDEIVTANFESVKMLQAKGYAGVYVSLSKDFATVSEDLKKSGIKLDNIKFVDGISRMYGIAPVENNDVKYVDGPMSSKALLEGISSSVRSLKDEKRFVVLDSLTTILLYNSVDATVDFGKTLRNLLENEHVAVIVTLPYSGLMNKEIVSKLVKDKGEVISIAELSEKNTIGRLDREVVKK